MAQCITRRDVVAGAAVAAVAATGVSAAVAQDARIGVPQEWAGEADLIVVGHGGAGCAASLTAAQEGLGSCIVFEAAPEEFDGGNTRVSGNIMFIPEDPEVCANYQAKLNGPYGADMDYLRVWAEGLHENFEWLEPMLDEVDSELVSSNDGIPEFPEYADGEGLHTWKVDGLSAQQAMWKIIAAKSQELGVDVRFDSRVVGLVQDPQTREVLGVEVEQGGEVKSYKANKGVLLACGGFENNPEMIRTYFPVGMPEIGFLGTPWNRGDGFKLASGAGAKFKNMNSYAALSWGVVSSDTEYPRNPYQLNIATNEYFFVGPDGKRFMNEDTKMNSKHGKVAKDGAYREQIWSTPAYVIFGQETFDMRFIGVVGYQGMGAWRNVLEIASELSNEEALANGMIKKGETPEELAEQIGLDAEALAETVARWNTFAQTGVDEDFGRGQEVKSSHVAPMVDENGQFIEQGTAEEKVVVKEHELTPMNGPFYGAKLIWSIVNTQGGPERGLGGEVLDWDYQPVPRLYSAGEFGDPYCYLYNGGGNVSEALSSGRIAIRSMAALEPWA